MTSTVSVNGVWFACLIVSAIFVIVYPFALAIVARIRLKISWRYFWYGALIFFVFQVITRAPLVLVLQNVFAAQIRNSVVFRWSWIVALVFTASLFEEVGRYVGYRLLMRKEEKTWSKAVMYGLGHGGLESTLLIGGQILLSVINIAVLSNLNLNTLPAAQHQQIVQQFASLNAQPVWFPLIGAWERLWTVPFHVGMSVVVLQVFRRNNITWLLLAILLHALLDFVAAGLLPELVGRGVTGSLIIEASVAIFGLFAIWLIWKLRDRSADARAEVEVTA